MIIDPIRELVKIVVLDSLAPTGKNLILTLKFVLVITVITVLIKWLGGVPYFSLYSCVLAIIVLLVLLIIERREYKRVNDLYNKVERRVSDGIQRMHGDGELHSEVNEDGQQTGSTCKKDE